MKGKRPQLLISIVLALVVILAVVLCCMLFVNTTIRLASANDMLSFSIKAISRTQWQLYKGDALLLSCNGEFFADENASSVAILDAIKNELVLDGIVSEEYADSNACYDQYNLTFDFSSGFVAECVGTTTTTLYTQKDDSPILIDASRSPFVNEVNSSTVKVVLEYKGVNDDSFIELTPSFDGNALRFGKNVNVGEYQVRVALRETFEFDGKMWDAYHYSTPITCKIEKAPYTNYQSARGNITYGEKVGEISVVDENSKGRWELSNNQNEVAFDGVENISDVMLGSGSYLINFNFYPNNANYLPAMDVAVPVKVDKATLIIYIGNLHAVVGAEVIDTSNVEVQVSGLIGDDTIEDINIKLKYPQDFDGKSVGTYQIRVASITNPNYEYVTFGLENKFASYGSYIVYRTSRQVVLDDGMVFEVFCAEGYKNLTIKAESVIVDVNQGHILVKAYKFSFYDFADNLVESPQEYVVAWDNGVDNAIYVYNVGGEVLNAGVTNRIVMSGEDDTIIFAKGDQTIIVYEPNLTDEAIVAIVLGVVLALILAISMVYIIPTTTLAIKVRALRKYDNYVYVREEVVKKKVANDTKKKQKEPSNKQRHGKKNKKNRQIVNNDNK